MSGLDSSGEVVNAKGTDVEAPAEVRWTPNQLRATRERGGHLLVSAAAGSGKTSVLVERVIRRVLDPACDGGIDRLLVVTFTEAAAAQMRARIGARLEQAIEAKPEDARAHQQLTLLGHASISTLHGFCLRLIREHFHRVGLDPGAVVMGDHEATLTRADALELVFAGRHAKEGPRFLALVEAYGGGPAPAILKRVVTQLHGYVRSLPRPLAWLEDAVTRYTSAAGSTIADLPYWRPLKGWLAVELGTARERMEGFRRDAGVPGGPAVYLETLAEDVEQLAGAALAADGATNWDELMAALAAVDFGSLRPARGVDKAIAIPIQKGRRKIKEQVDGLRRQLLDRTESEWLAELVELAPHVAELADLVRELDERYLALKRRRTALDFDDLQHLALAVLGEWDDAGGRWRPTEVALELQARFDEVLVDEFQDVNGVQEAILALVSRGVDGASGNRFVVGDVKQSIYGFRHTDPAVFHGIQQAFARGEGGRAIVLSENFRSRRPILDAVNFVFRQVMQASLGGVPYGVDAELRFGAGFPAAADESSQDHPVELHLIERGSKGADGDSDVSRDSSPRDREPLGAFESWLESADAAEKEAVVIAHRIRALVEGDAATGEAPARVWERGANDEWTPRPSRWEDVVVLLRSAKGRANTLVSVLTRAGIPAHAALGTGWFAETEIEIMLSLLAVLENPRQDVELAAVLLSPLVGLHAADLARIRLADPRGDFLDAARKASGSPELDPVVRDRLAWSLTRLEEWRTAARRGSLSRLVWRIYGETRFLDVSAAMPGGEQRRANLLALHDRAREFDHFARQGLARFLAFIQRLRDEGEELGSAPTFGAGENVVKIVTVHRAKGLEFPFVVVADLGKEMNEQDLRGDVLSHRELGLGLRVVDLEKRAKYPSLAYLAVRNEARGALRAEELRVLYVALTRARERLLLVGSTRDLAGDAARWSTSVHVEGVTLPEAQVAAGTRALDWIVPAVARHPDGEPIRRAAGLDPNEAPREPSADPSRWRVRVWGPDELTRASLSVSGGARPKGHSQDFWARVAALDPTVFPAQSSHDASLLAARFAWRYPHRAVAGRFAKMSVTELKARFAAGAPADEDAAPVEAGLLRWGQDLKPGRRKKAQSARTGGPRRFIERPRFLDSPPGPMAGAEPLATTGAIAKVGNARASSGGADVVLATPPSGVDVGIATHLVLRHLDLAAAVDADAVRAAIAAMLDRGLIGAEHAVAAAVESIAAFARSELGRRISAAESARVRREIPFTLGIPAGDIHPDLSGDDAKDLVVVQGVIDLLMEAEDRKGFVLLDYKTDRVSGDRPSIEQAVARYRGQMALYARAVSRIFTRPVVESWLCFLVPGVAARLSGPLVDGQEAAP